MLIRILFIFFILLTSTYAQTLKDISLRLQWKHQFEFAGFYAAKELGYYNEVGLNVNFFEYENGIDLINEVESQKIDLGIWGSGVIEQASNGKEITLLANYFKRAPLAIVTQPEIKFPSDLIGKKLMIPKSDFNSANYIQMFKASKIEQSDITMVDPTFNMDDFINKKVDAASIFLTNEPFILNQKNIKYNILDPSNYGVVLYDVNLFTSNDFLNKNKQEVEDFIDATNKGWEYAINNYEEIVNLILKKYNTQNKSKEHLLFEAQETIKMMQPKNYPIGSIDMKQINRIVTLFTDLKMITQKKDLDSIILNKSKLLNTKINLGKEEEEFLKEKKSLNACVINDGLPFNNIDENNRYEGIGSDVITKISKNIGLKLDIRNINSINELNDKCDISSIHQINFLGKNKVNFSTPIMLSPYVIVSNTNNQLFVENLDNLLDKIFVVTKNNPVIDKLKHRYKKINLLEVDSVEDAFKTVLNGEAYGYIDNALNVTYNMQQSSIYNLKIIGKLKFITARYAVGLSNNEILNSIIEKAINSINKNELQDIQNKWISFNIEDTTNFDNLIKILLLILFLFLMVVFWNYRLKKQVDKQLQDLRKKDNLIMEQARFYSIGQTVGNIAHQWKIPLTHIGTVNTTMEVMLKHGSQEKFLENATKNIENIKNSVQLMKSTLDDFLNYYTTTPVKKEFKPYNTLQDNILQLLYNKILLKNVDVKLDFDKELVINNYEYVFANIFMILFDNSLDAFEKESTNNKINIEITKDNKNILVRFLDNAGGIKIQPVEKVFDYFVTTKDKEGHGLGLTTVKMLVEERLEGNISVENLADGACFTIKLPSK